MKYIAAFLSFLFGAVAFLCTLGYVEMFMGITVPTEIPIVLEGTMEYAEVEAELVGQDVGSILLIIVSLFLSSYFFSLYHRLDRKKKDTFNYRGVKEPFVLYLRSFIDDKKTGRRVSLLNDIRSEEEVLVDILSDIAPVYAIGDPRDKRMPVGASRIYVDDENWKATVFDMAKRATVVVLRLGATDSFWWEVEMAIKNLPVGNILFVVPESKTFSNVAILYKLLLENGIDIKSLNINIEKKLSGSISSFLFFDNEGKPVANEVDVPRFTRLVISYENVIRNTLSGFRAKYGLRTRYKNTVRFARLFQILLILFILFIGGSKMFTDYVDLKYQMPYELVERCIEKPDFVEKYSDEINGTNLTWSVIESRKGSFALDDESYKLLFTVEADAIASMSEDEYARLRTLPKNMLLMIKKYVPDRYDAYVETLSEAAMMAIRHPRKIDTLIRQYKLNMDSMPQWMVDFADSGDFTGNEHDNVVECNRMLVGHMDEEGIVDVLKTLSGQTINLK